MGEYIGCSIWVSGAVVYVYGRRFVGDPGDEDPVYSFDFTDRFSSEFEYPPYSSAFFEGGGAYIVSSQRDAATLTPLTVLFKLDLAGGSCDVVFQAEYEAESAEVRCDAAGNRVVVWVDNDTNNVDHTEHLLAMSVDNCASWTVSVLPDEPGANNYNSVGRVRFSQCWLITLSYSGRVCGGRVLTSPQVAPFRS